MGGKPFLDPWPLMRPQRFFGMVTLLSPDKPRSYITIQILVIDVNLFDINYMCLSVDATFELWSCKEEAKDPSNREN